MAISSAKFITSASKLAQCPEASLPEITVIGRSNVGKSSLINMLTGHNGLAKASHTPGKTQLMNYFLINEARYLVDLPGYGYAKVARTSRAEWMDMIQDYLTQRETLKKILVLIDGSIPPQRIDNEFIATLEQERLPYAILITKTDKVKQGDLHKNMLAITNMIRSASREMPIIIQTSSNKGRGKDQVISYIEELLNEKN